MSRHSACLHVVDTALTEAPRAGLSEHDSQQLLYKLVASTAMRAFNPMRLTIDQHHLISHPSSTIATRKLCSTLAQYFSKPISTWSQCLRSLAVSLAQQQPILDDALDSHPSTWDILPLLSDQQLQILLEFAMNLADEVKKLSNIPE